MKEQIFDETDLCCKNCLCRKEKSLYCYKIHQEITLNQSCQYLVYRLRHDIQEINKTPKYIKVDELNAKIHEEYDPSDNDDIHIGMGIVQELLNEMPSADVIEVKHGHWELDGTCSVCKKHILQSYENFCCYCGADMRERRESE